METPLAQVGHRHTGACVIGENKGRIVIWCGAATVFLAVVAEPVTIQGCFLR